MNESGDDLHPNWVALATVDFERKAFVREGVEPIRSAPRTTRPQGSLSGEEVKKFYAEVVLDEEAKKLPSQRGRCRQNNAKRKGNVHDDDAPRRKKAATVRRSDVTEKEIRLFLTAAEKDDAKTLSEMYDEIPELLNAVDAFRWTALMCAAQAKSLNSISFLTSKGADAELADKRGRTARSLGANNGLSPDLFLPISTKAEEIGNVRKRLEEDTCKVCGQRFEKTNDKKHVTSTLHLFCSNRHKKMKTIYGIPESNRGYQILLRTGWDRENGLGRNGGGKKFPIKAKQKIDKNGIGYEKIPRIKSEFHRPEECLINNSKLDRRKLTREKIIEINIRKELSLD